MGKSRSTQIDTSFSNKELPLIEALRASYGKVLLGNKDVDGYLKSGNLLPTVRTGTMLIYDTPGVVFGSRVEYSGLTYNVPKEYQGLANCALVLKHPNFKVEGRTLRGDRVNVVENFPALNGWYGVDEAFGIPQGSSKESRDPSARQLLRLDGPCISMVVRGSHSNLALQDWRSFSVIHGPNQKFGLIWQAETVDEFKKFVNFLPDQIIRLLARAKDYILEAIDPRGD